jgi:hypothetical protein
MNWTKPIHYSSFIQAPNRFLAPLTEPNCFMAIPITSAVPPVIYIPLFPVPIPTKRTIAKANRAAMMIGRITPHFSQRKRAGKLKALLSIDLTSIEARLSQQQCVLRI